MNNLCAVTADTNRHEDEENRVDYQEYLEANEQIFVDRELMEIPGEQWGK